MRTEQIIGGSLVQEAARWKGHGRAAALALLLLALSFGGGGCAGGYVSTRGAYVGAYPDYSPYYGYYGYGGAPYYGYGGSYGGRIVVSGRRYSRGYGRHHFVRERGHSRRSISRGSGRRGSDSSGARRGRGRGRDRDGR